MLSFSVHLSSCNHLTLGGCSSWKLTPCLCVYCSYCAACWCVNAVCSEASLHDSSSSESLQQGKILEKLGICSDLSLLRVVLDGIPPRRDPKLLIKDLKVDEVPVRIYQPKWPPTGKRRGILYFHGGAGTFGSISKRCKFYFPNKSKPLCFYLQMCIS